MKRIRNRKGETLVESLSAILIVAVVAAFLSQAIAAAARSNRQVADSDRSFSYQDPQENTNFQIKVSKISSTGKPIATDSFLYTVNGYETKSGDDDSAPYIYRWYGIGGGGT